MPKRDIPLINEEYYHIFNRGVAKQPTYFVKKDYQRFLTSLDFYRFNNLPMKLSRFLHLPHDDRELLITKLKTANNVCVELICYCLMPNHFHLLVKQVCSDGIARFIRHLTDSYTKYINTKYERVGPLYQGRFKAVHVDSDEQLLHVSRYIHLNPVVAYLVKKEDLLQYPWSSLSSYINADERTISPSIILDNFSSVAQYKEFVFDQVDYARALDAIKHLTLD